MHIVHQALRVRPVQRYDWEEWRRMRHALWPQDTVAEVEHAMREWIQRADATVLVALRANGSCCGFVEVGARSHADGCESSPVGYIEGWYVDPDMRRQGHGRALLEAAEAWARDAGFVEMASDTDVGNSASQRAHARAGYEEVGRVVQFRKRLVEDDYRLGFA